MSEERQLVNLMLGILVERWTQGERAIASRMSMTRLRRRATRYPKLRSLWPSKIYNFVTLSNEVEHRAARDIAEELAEARAQIEAEGGPLISTWEELEEETAFRRGEYREDTL